jgi:4-aminobutyrate aminotransferase
MLTSFRPANDSDPQVLGTAVPNVLLPLPGPLAQGLIETDEFFTSPSYTRVYPLAVKRGEGAMLEDVDGNKFLDFNAGIAVCATGHCHPQVVAAIREQAGLLLHMSGTDFYNEPQCQLARKLAEIAPGTSPKQVFFGNSGTEAIEAAFKLARYHTRRPRMISFFGAFHGRTFGAMSLTGSKAVQRRFFEPLVPGVTHTIYPNRYRAPEDWSDAEVVDDALKFLEQTLFKKTVPPEEVAAIIVEPIQGEGGYLVPPDGFLTRLKELAERFGILLIADEVQSGMGRTGKMFACEHWGLEPDILCTAKGIASGMPLSAMIARTELMSWVPGSHASTFGGNPISCAAALATIKLLESGLIDNAARMGDLLIEQLRELSERHPLIGDVRGKGLMIGIELVQDRQSKIPASKEREELVRLCFERGLLILGCGENCIRLCPPLIINENNIGTALRIFDEALSEIEAQASSRDLRPAA